MKSKWLLKVVVILGLVFFSGRLVSHLFLFLADTQDHALKTSYLKASYLFFPLDHFSAYRYGFNWLEQGANQKNTALIERSIQWFEKSLKLNPFFYLTHHHLGKAYLLYNYPNSEYFDEGVTELKRAVKIYQNNQFMARDISEVLLSMWPLLGAEDKLLSQKMLLKFMSRFSWEEFKPLVELWWLYSKDISYMKKLLEKNPEFLLPVAQLLLQVGAPLDLRWTFMADFETHLLKKVIRQYRQGSPDHIGGSGFELNLLNDLREIKRYDILLPGQTFNQDRFRKYKLLFTGRRIRFLIMRYQENPTPTLRDEIGQLIMEYFETGPEMKELMALQDLADQKGLFDANDLQSLKLKYQIKFNLQDLSEMIDEIESFRHSLSHVKSDHAGDFFNILLLLSDAYESSKLLTIADKILKEVLRMDSDNPDAWFRIFRIQLVLGDDELEKQAVFREKIDLLKQSRFLTVTEPHQTFAVFLMDSKEIQISVNPDLINHLQEKRIIQVFIGGLIRYEEYIDRLSDPIKLEVEGAGEMEKVVVEVKFL